ncbi:MAG: hypothetical protein LIO87_10685 [Eubacterium sp.]|nr:hypothetical protein [Eubacterium sp.]
MKIAILGLSLAVIYLGFKAAVYYFTAFGLLYYITDKYKEEIGAEEARKIGIKALKRHYRLK